jgi:Putative polyhydroxyalkanoic acid system protein (PHA_gran_rgn)
MAKVSVSHTLSRQEAKRRVQGLIPELKSEYAGVLSDAQEDWDGNVGAFRFRAKGFAISGKVVIGQSTVDVDYTLPLLARPFGPSFERSIRQRLTTLLSSSSGPG